MHQLTHVVLGLHGSAIAPAAAYSVLTASSKLQHLMIYHCQLPAGAWQHMFPAARQLPHLTMLDLSNVCKPDSASPALAPGASSLVSCCPGLQALRIQHLLCSAEPLAPLTGLSSLRELVLQPAGDSSTALDVVCQLTGLRRLIITDPASEDSDLFLQLTQLKQLTYLQVSTPEERPHWKTYTFYSGVSLAGGACAALSIPLLYTTSHRSEPIGTSVAAQTKKLARLSDLLGLLRAARGLVCHTATRHGTTSPVRPAVNLTVPHIVTSTCNAIDTVPLVPASQCSWPFMTVLARLLSVQAPNGEPVWQQVLNHYNTPRVEPRYGDSSDDSVGGDEGSDDRIDSDTD
jgi:hypothetical protein